MTNYKYFKCKLSSMSKKQCLCLFNLFYSYNLTGKIQSFVWRLFVLRTSEQTVCFLIFWRPTTKNKFLGAKSVVEEKLVGMLIKKLSDERKEVQELILRTLHLCFRIDPEEPLDCDIFSYIKVLCKRHSFYYKLC